MLLPESRRAVIGREWEGGGRPEEPRETLATSGEDNYKNCPFVCQPP